MPDPYDVLTKARLPMAHMHDDDGACFEIPNSDQRAARLAVEALAAAGLLITPEHLEMDREFLTANEGLGEALTRHRRFAEWLVSLDNPQLAERAYIELRDIIDRAREALNGGNHA